MKNRIWTLIALLPWTVFAQAVNLTEAKTTNENNDQRLYKLEQANDAQYLGKIEILGPLENGPAAFQKFYQKARSLGANAFIFQSKKNLENQEVVSNTREIALYYSQTLPENANSYLVFNDSKGKEILVNGEKVSIPQASYYEGKIVEGESNYIATKKFLGSRVNLYYKEGQPQQNFQVISGGVRSDKSGVTGGLILKTGDLIVLERSYANFLSMFFLKSN